MTFVEAVVAAQDWAERTGAQARITRATGIDGGDGRVWVSFIINTTGAAPGRMASDIPEVVEVFRKTTEDFDFTVG